jgi:hypothetical protein
MKKIFIYINAGIAFACIIPLTLSVAILITLFLSISKLLNCEKFNVFKMLVVRISNAIDATYDFHSYITEGE